MHKRSNPVIKSAFNEGATRKSDIIYIYLYYNYIKFEQLGCGCGISVIRHTPGKAGNEREQEYKFK
jgi:hypothetical protein